jgi:nicotinamidase-related amidase
LTLNLGAGFSDPPYQGKTLSTPDCLANISSIITAFRAASLPVIHIHHHSTNPSSPLHPVNSPEGIKPYPAAALFPGETLFTKNVNSSFIGTGLEDHLRNHNITTLVVVGLTTSHCVSTTVRMAGNLGWTVFLPRDATGMFAREAAPGAPEGVKEFDAVTMHEVALSELHGEFATVVKTSDVLHTLLNRG